MMLTKNQYNSKFIKKNTNAGGFLILRMEDCGIRTFDTLFSFFLLQKHSLEGFSIVLFWHYSGVYGGKG